jgi:hypothetical protein
MPPFSVAQLNGCQRYSGVAMQGGIVGVRVPSSAPQGVVRVKKSERHKGKYDSLRYARTKDRMEKGKIIPGKRRAEQLEKGFQVARRSSLLPPLPPLPPAVGTTN